MPQQNAMRVAIVSTNDPRNFSGGRYHGLMIAYAIGATGGEPHYVTDHVPSFMSDLEPLAPGSVVVHQTDDFVSSLPGGQFDWVLIVPTGIFLPDFYESCLDFASRANARVGLVNFESANWFNALSPSPRDPRLWDYWRRICTKGGLILSSTRVSDSWARKFYHAPDGQLRFEVWYPPVNSVAAKRFDGLPKDGSILAFIRPQDQHKGSNILCQINPKLYAGRILRLISGRDVPSEFTAAMEAHLDSVSDARLEVLLRITDLHKFRLLTSADVILFPTAFEGFGYPPVEAAYSGTECVCFDLPVLKETAFATAHFSETGNLLSFEDSIAAAFAKPERRETLRAAVYRNADFHRAAWQLADILLRSADSVAPITTRTFRVPVGPFAKTQPVLSKDVVRKEELPSFPPYVVSAVTTTAGEVLITGRSQLPAGVDRLEAAISGGSSLPITCDLTPQKNSSFKDARFYLVAPKEILRRRLDVRGYGASTPFQFQIELQVDKVSPSNPLRPAIAGISENVTFQGGRRIRGWVLGREPITAIFMSLNGEGWHRFDVAGERRDVLAKNPGYGSAKCEFTASLKGHDEPDKSNARIVCLAGKAHEQYAIDLLVGWPPSSKPHFSGVVALGEEVSPTSPPTKSKVAVRSASAHPPKPLLLSHKALPRRAKIGNLAIIDRTDATWKRGVARRGERGRLGAIIVSKSDDFAKANLGTVIRFDSGVSRCVTSIEQKDNTAVLVLDGPLDLPNNTPLKSVALYSAQAPEHHLTSFVLSDWSDNRWWRGVWNHRDHRYRQGITIKKDVAMKLGVGKSAQLRFAASGLRTVLAHDDDNNNNRRLWLDKPVRPMGDGMPNPVSVEFSVLQESGALTFNLARSRAGWPHGILEQHQGDLRALETIFLDRSARGLLRRGMLLLFARNKRARVTRVLVEADGLVVSLDARLDPVQHGHPAAALLVDEADAAEGVAPSFQYPNPELKANDPLYFLLATYARRHGAAFLSPCGHGVAAARALVVSPVSPCPANQGNRVVTRNIIKHLVALGFLCDVIVQNYVDAALASDEFGLGVRFFTVPFPKWEEATSVKTRSTVAEAAASLGHSSLDAVLAKDLMAASENFHPYFIVRDETVDIASALYSRNEYGVLVCNYTHMARVASELRNIRELPPTAIITHDALSRLPREFGGKRLDLMYRACPVALERDVLNSVPEAVVVAISRNEAEYFKEIGVENKIVLTEFDAAEEMARYRITEVAFERQSIIFPGSANPMNSAGLDWFVDECWSEVLTAVPGARLVVCGRVGTTWKPGLPGIEIVGELPRHEMLGLCSAASMSINPCVAGTGLKIKTVEAACLGLPAVCLPTAVDGLEDVADEFAIVANDGATFAAACISLLTDASRWKKLHFGALSVADTRFSAQSVYGEFDSALKLSARLQWVEPGWNQGQSEPSLPEVENPVLRLEADPNDEAGMLSLGKRLVRAGQVDVGWDMVSTVAARRRGDCGVAMEAASVALQIGECWAAVTHAATAIAQRPTLGEAYRLMGEGLLGCNLPHDAAAVLEQGVLASPCNGRILALLDEAMTLAGRHDEAAVWRVQRQRTPSFGQYVSFGGGMTGKFARGFESGNGEGLLLSSGVGSVWITLPEQETRRIYLSIDFLRADGMQEDLSIEIDLHGASMNAVIRAEGARVQTVVVEAGLASFEDLSAVLLTVKLEDGVRLASAITLIGYLLTAERQNAEKLIVAG